MQDANSYAINIGLNLDDKLTSRLKRVKDNLYDLDKDAIKSINNFNKVNHAIEKIQRIGVEHIQSNMAHYSKIYNMSEDRLKVLIDSAKAQNDLNENTKVEKNILDGIKRQHEEIINDGINKIREDTEAWKGKVISIKEAFISITSKLADILGLGQEWSKTISASAKAYSILDKFFLTGFKKRMTQQKKLTFVDEDGITKTYQYKTRAERKFIESVLKGKKKQIKDVNNLEKISKGGKGVGGGGGGGGKITGGGFGAGASGAGSALLATGGMAAIAAVAVAIGTVVGAVALLNKSLKLASEQFEHFHTVNFLASGGAQVLTEGIFTLGMAGINTTEEIQKAASAIASLGYVAITASGNINKNFLAMTNLVANFTRATGVAEDQVASFISMQRGLGTTFTGPGGTLSGLYRITMAMRKYGITSQEASSILKSAQDVTYKLAVTFNKGNQAASLAVAAYSRVAIAAKQLGLDVSEASNLLNGLADNMLNFIVVTGGASLRGPLEGMAAIVENINNIEASLPEDPLVRDILLKNVYKISDKDLKIAQKLSKNFDEWKTDLLAGEKNQEEIAKIQKYGAKDFLKSMEQTSKAASEIEAMAKNSNNNIERQWQLLKSMVLSILGKVGSQLMPTFVAAGKILISAVSGLMEMVTGTSITGIDDFMDVLSNAADSSTEFAKAIDRSAQASYDQAALDDSFAKLQQKFESDTRTIDDKFINSMKKSIQNKETIEQLELSRGKKLTGKLHSTLLDEISQKQKSIAESGDLDFEAAALAQQTGDALSEAAKGLKIRESKEKSILERMVDVLFDVAIGIGMLVDKFTKDATIVQKAVAAQSQYRDWLTDKEIARIHSDKKAEEKRLAKESNKVESKPIAMAAPARERSDKISEKVSNIAIKDREAQTEVIVNENGEVVGMLSKNNAIAEEQLNAIRNINKTIPSFAKTKIWG